MTGWMIFLIVLAFFFLISQIRLGGQAGYGADGATVAILIGPFRVQVLPSDPSRKGKRKEMSKGDKAHSVREQPEKTDGTVGRILELLPTVAETAGALKRRIRIDHLSLCIVWGADDPASAAIGYGRANALLGMIWPLLDNNFKVKKCDLQADVDYALTAPTITADAALTMTLGQLISFVVIYGWKLLTSWSRSGRRSKEKQEAECYERK